MENFLLGKKSKAECSYTLGEQENAHNQEEMLRHNLTVNPWQGDPARHPPQEWRVWTPHWASPLCLRDKPPKGLALKANRAHKHKSHKGKGSWEMVLKWLVHGLTYPMAQHGSSCLQSTKTFYERGLFAYLLTINCWLEAQASDLIHIRVCWGSFSLGMEASECHPVFFLLYSREPVSPKAAAFTFSWHSCSGAPFFFFFFLAAAALITWLWWPAGLDKSNIYLW